MAGGCDKYSETKKMSMEIKIRTEKAKPLDSNQLNRRNVFYTVCIYGVSGNGKLGE